MSLIRPDLSYDRRAVMLFAWGAYRRQLNQRGTRSYKPFGYFLADAWKLARCARQRRADGALAREIAQTASRMEAVEQYRASLTDEQRATSDAWLICLVQHGRSPRPRSSHGSLT